MAESIAPAHPFDADSSRNEWAVLLECASPAPDGERLRGLLPSADGERLLALAEMHGVTGHLASCLPYLDGNLVPPEIRQELVDRLRAQTFLTMRLTAELFHILDLFTSEG